MTAKFGLLIGAKVTGENNIKKLGNSMQGVQGKAKNLAGAVKGVGAAFKALFAAAAVAGFGAFVKSAIDSADAFGKLSVRTGVAADKLQAYVNAGKLADVSQSEIENGLRKLAQTQSEAADGVATYSEAYGKLGLKVKDADGKLKPSDKLLGEIADKFKDLPNGPEKAAVAMDIFGRSGSKLITLLNGGSEALERFNYETSENFAQNAEFFNDQIEILKISFDGFRMQLADALLPALNAILEVFGDLFSSGQDFGPLFKVIEVGVRGVASVILGLVQSMRFFIRVITDLVKIAQLVAGGKFGEAFNVAETGIADTGSQFFVDMQAQQKVLFGSSEAGADYFSRGTGSFAPRSVKAGKSKTDRETDKRKKEADAFNAKLIGQAIAENNQRKELLATYHTENQLATIRLQKGQEFADQINEITTLMRKNGFDFNKAFDLVKAKADAQALQDQQDENNAKQEAALEKIKGLYQSIKDTIATGLVNAMQGLIDGTKTLGESLSGILRQLGSIFLQFGMKNLVSSIFPSAKGNVFAQNKIVPFAYGGVVNKPTLFPMANGMGLMGEAGPEAVLPLRRGKGGRLGVETSGGTIGNVVVNVDASGSKVQGNQPDASQLGKAIGQAVQAELIKQKRPGGLLTR